MTKTRKNFTAVQKTVIVRECLEGGYSLSEICEKYQVHPSMVGRWKKRLFEGAIETFNREQSRNQKKEERQVKELRQKHILSLDRSFQLSVREIPLPAIRVMGQDEIGPISRSGIAPGVERQ